MNIVITGGTKGIGRALLSELITKHKVLVVARSTSALEKEYKGVENVYCLSLDLSTPDSYISLVKWINRKWGKADVIVNCAAMLVNKHIEDTTADEILRTFTLNVITPALLVSQTKSVLSSNGFYINISSPVIYRATPNIWLYASTKSALSLVGETAKLPTRVLTYYPGIIDTNMITGHKSLVSRLIMRKPSYTAKKLSQLITARKTGTYYEFGARIIQFAGIIGL